jgi:hypothetical protein
MPFLGGLSPVQGVPYLRRSIGCDLAPMGGVTHPGPFRVVRGAVPAPSTALVQAAARPSPMSVTPTPAPGAIRVLIVDDEPELTNCSRSRSERRAAVPLRGRRGRRGRGGRVLGDLMLGERTREVRRGGTQISLTAKEFDRLPLPRPRRRERGGSRAGHRGGDHPGARRPRRGGRRTRRHPVHRHPAARPCEQPFRRNRLTSGHRRPPLPRTLPPRTDALPACPARSSAGRGPSRVSMTVRASARAVCRSVLSGSSKSAPAVSPGGGPSAARIAAAGTAPHVVLRVACRRHMVVVRHGRRRPAGHPDPCAVVVPDTSRYL